MRVNRKLLSRFNIRWWKHKYNKEIAVGIVHTCMYVCIWNMRYMFPYFYSFVWNRWSMKLAFALPCSFFSVSSFVSNTCLLECNARCSMIFDLGCKKSKNHQQGSCLVFLYPWALLQSLLWATEILASDWISADLSLIFVICHWKMALWNGSLVFKRPGDNGLERPKLFGRNWLVTLLVPLSGRIYPQYFFWNPSCLVWVQSVFNMHWWEPISTLSCLAGALF